MPELLALLCEGRDELGMLMPERVHRNARTEIDVLIAIEIPHTRPFSAVEHDMLGCVVRDIDLLASIYQMLCV